MGDHHPVSEDGVTQEGQPRNESHNLKVGGFPEELFENLADNEKEALTCNICRNLVNQCQRCNNSHLFCKSCIFVWTQMSSTNCNKCPVCRALQLEYFPVLEVDEQLLKEKVSCLVEDCKFRSNLKSFLLHVHGKSAYCNEPKDYDGFKAECGRSNAEQQAEENERLVELINFIEGFNILRSLMTLEVLVRHNQPLALSNLLQNTTETSEDPEIRLESPDSGNLDGQYRLDAGGVLNFAPNDDLPRVGEHRIQSNPRSDLMLLIPVASLSYSPSRDSNASWTTRSSNDSSTIESSLSFHVVEELDLDSDYISSARGQLSRTNERRLQIDNAPTLVSSSTVQQSSASTDTLTENHSAASGSHHSVVGNLASRKSETNQDVRRDELRSFNSGWFEPRVVPEAGDQWDSSFEDEDLLLTEESLTDSLSSSDRSTISSSVLPLRMPPPRVSGMPLSVATKKSLKDIPSRYASNPPPVNSCKKVLKSANPFEVADKRNFETKKPPTSMTKSGMTRTQYSEMPQFGRNRTVTGTNFPPTKYSTKKDVSNSTSFWPKLTKSTGLKQLNDIPGSYETKTLRQNTSLKPSDPPKKPTPAVSTSKVKSFKLPSIFSSLSSSAKLNGSSKPQKTTPKPNSLSSEKKLVPKTSSFSGIAKK